MAFAGKRLKNLDEKDIRQLVTSGEAEHLYLEYKAEQYDNGHAGRRDFLLDICMFANAQGGLLLIGVPEQRDEKGQPTGLPDSAAQIGIEIENPELLLQSYDGRIASCIEERLAVESHAIAVTDGHYVLAFRVPDSIRKPHCVRFDGHIYFPSRRERNLYHMDVREIKDLSMRTASQLERAETLGRKAITPSTALSKPLLMTALVPVFFREFLVDLKNDAVYQAFARIRLSKYDPPLGLPKFGMEGLLGNSGGGL